MQPDVGSSHNIGPGRIKIGWIWLDWESCSKLKLEEKTLIWSLCR